MDGQINTDVRVNPNAKKLVNVAFRAKWRNAGNIGESEAGIIALDELTLKEEGSVYEVVETLFWRDA